MTRQTTHTIPERLMDELASRDAAMRADLARHVSIPTGHNHKTGLDEYRGLVLERLTALGGEVELIAGDERAWWLGGPGAREVSASDIPPTAIVRRRGGENASGGRRALIAGHLDTVFPPDGSFREMAVSADGKTAVGPGVVDMKGGVLIALNALEALSACGFDVGWTVVLNSDEETGSYFSDSALRRAASEADVGLALEPALPGGELAVERKGSGQFLVEVHGRSAHAGREFEKGISAVYALAEVLAKIEGLVDLASGVTVNIGPIVGGTATNAVADRAAAWGNARYPTPALGEALGARLDELAGTDGRGARIVIERSFNRPAKPMTPGTAALAELARDVAEGIGQSLPFAKTGGVCDGNILQDAGLATIDTLGVRGGGLHTEQEWIELASLVERSQLLAGVLLRLWEGG